MTHTTNQPRTTFAGDINIFTGLPVGQQVPASAAPARKPRAKPAATPAQSTMPSPSPVAGIGFVFCDDPLPPDRKIFGSKYGALLGAWKPGQAVKLPTRQVAAVAHAAAKHFKAAGLVVRTIKKYPGDTSATPGRVWLLRPEQDATDYYAARNKNAATGKTA